MASIKSILLIKKSSFQIFLANQLFKRRIIDLLIVEEGFSIDQNINIGVSIFKSKILISNSKLLFSFLKNPTNIFYFIFKIFLKSSFYGQKEYYDEKILKNNYKNIDTKLKTIFVKNINDNCTINEIIKHNPISIYVFGTSIISENLMSRANCPIINFHWGKSPEYRGEGIISSLAYEGKKGPALTLHLLSNKIDSGKILFQKKPLINKLDNFYSIGLKLTVLSIDYIDKIHKNIINNHQFEYLDMENKKSFYFNSAYMRKNPILYYKAWRNLKGNK